MLHGITQPTADVTLFINPRQCIRYIKLTNALASLADFRRCHEIDTLLLGTCRQSLDEVKDIARKRLSDTQSRKLHEDIDDLLLLGETSNTIDIGISKERIAIPLRIVEAQ